MAKINDRRKGGPGRKELPESEKSRPICIHRKQKEIDAIGGIETARDMFHDFIDKLLKRKK